MSAARGRRRDGRRSCARGAGAERARGCAWGRRPSRIVAEKADGVREVTVGARRGPCAELLDRHGLPPLPPYIARHDAPKPDDRERYQTVYARHRGSIAAPTAGLHFTPSSSRASPRSAPRCTSSRCTSGVGTFRPLAPSASRTHRIAPEDVEIPAGHRGGRQSRARRGPARRGHRHDHHPGPRVGGRRRTAGCPPCRGAADLFIYPGHRFRVVDALVTNFHLPRSTLLLLTAAFCGREALLRRLPPRRRRALSLLLVRRCDADRVACAPSSSPSCGTDGAARAGRLRTPHGEVETPAFMPVATQGSVKSLSPTI